MAPTNRSSNAIAGLPAAESAPPALPLAARRDLGLGPLLRAFVVEDWPVLRWMLPLALLHGLLYLAIVPPWRHYDEPSHFEYASLIASLGRTPTLDDSNPELRREITASMYQSRFAPALAPADILAADPPRTGENQLVHPPLYYTIVAAATGWLQYADIDLRLYGARTVSLIFYTLTIIAAWRVGLAAAPDEPLAQLLLPMLLLLTPSFADLMTAVNSDVLVNFAATAMLLGCVLLIRDGPRPTGLLLALLGLAAALLTKRTAFVAVVPCALAMLWSLRRQRIPIWASLSLPLVIIGLTAVGCLRLVVAQGASGAHTAVELQPWLIGLDQRYLRLQIADWFISLTDLERSGWVYAPLAQVAFVSFWVHFGWDDIGLGSLAEWLAYGLAGATALGLLTRAWQNRHDLEIWQRRCIWLCFVIVSAAWLAIVARVHPLPAPSVRLYFPRGRYAFWAMLPTLWLLALGWQGLLPPRWRPAGPLALLALFALFDGAVVLALFAASYYA